MGKGLDAKRALPLLALALLTVPLVLFLFGAVTAQMDAPPAGSSCTFEIDEGSGPAGTGREEIRWGWFPTKYCVGSMGGSTDGEWVVEDEIYPLGLLGLLIYPAAAFAGLIVWFAGRYLLLHPEVFRRKAPLEGRDGSISRSTTRLFLLYLAGLAALWGASFAGALNWGVARAPLHVSYTPGRDLLGGVLWSSWVAVAMVLGGYLIARRSRIGPALAITAWLVGLVFAFRSWAHSCDAITGAGCDGRGFVSVGVLGTLSVGMVIGCVLARAHRRPAVPTQPSSGLA